MCDATAKCLGDWAEPEVQVLGYGLVVVRIANYFDNLKPFCCVFLYLVWRNV